VDDEIEKPGGWDASSPTTPSLLTCRSPAPAPAAVDYFFLPKNQAVSCHAETMRSLTKGEKDQPNQNKKGLFIFVHFS
jgi:hypothetical protein